MKKNYYIIDVQEDTVTTRAKLEKLFNAQCEELRWDYCDCIDEYIAREQMNGNLIVLEDEPLIIKKTVLTPKQCGKLIGYDISDDISLAEFDEKMDDDCFWNFPLSEFSEILENESKVVVVKFADGTYRFCEV